MHPTLETKWKVCISVTEFRNYNFESKRHHVFSYSFIVNMARWMETYVYMYMHFYLSNKIKEFCKHFTKQKENVFSSVYCVCNKRKIRLNKISTVRNLYAYISAWQQKYAIVMIFMSLIGTWNNYCNSKKVIQCKCIFILVSLCISKSKIVLVQR